MIKTIIKTGILFILILIMHQTFAHVSNPGFETGSTPPQNWKFVAHNENMPIWDIVSYSGLKSVIINIPGRTNLKSGYPRSDLITAEPLQYNTFSAWMKAEGVDGNVSPEGTIEINEDKMLSINGKKTFPVYMYYICNGYFESKGMAEPCNLLDNNEFLFSGGGELYNLLTNDRINKFEEANVSYTILASAGIPPITSDIINSPSFFGYWLDDEPDDTEVSKISNMYAAIKAKDDEHPVILNHWQNMVKWSPYTDIITWDIYPIRYHEEFQRMDAIYVWEQWSEQDFFKSTNLNSINKPVWAVIQANGIRLDDLYVPTPQEARANTYTAITTDVKGIGFWGYLTWGGSLTPTSEFPMGTPGLYNDKTLHAYYRQLGRELTSLNDILVLPTKDYSWHYYSTYSGRKSTDLVTFSYNPTKTVLWKERHALNYLLKESGENSYLIVVNKDSGPISNVEITVSGLSGSMTAKTLGLETNGSSMAGRNISVNDGKFTDNFDGYAAHIYQIS